MPVRFLETLWRDARFALRQLRRARGFAITVIGLLALGIGANTTMFSIVNAVLIEPLPFKDPDRLLRLWESNPKLGLLESAASVPNFHDWQTHQSVLENVAAAEMNTFNLTSGSEPERVAAAGITANLLPTLGVSPFLGRNFLPEEEKAGRDRVVLLSHGLWQRQFGGDSQLLNKNIELNNENYTVVGIMPPGFDFPGTRELWIPLILDPAKEPWRADRGNRNLWVFGRLKPRITVEQANAEMSVLAARLEQQYPKSNTRWGVRVRTFKDWMVPANVRRSILALFVAVGLVLLIVCANVASLLLVRARARLLETALRVALGATRRRVIQQLVVETLIIANLGGLIGLLLAFLGTKLVMSAVAQNVGRSSWSLIDGRVLIFTFVTSLATGLIFGLVSSWWATRISLVERINEGGRSGHSRITQGLARSLVVVEVTLALTLLVSAGLMLRSFVRLQNVTLGFEPEHVLTSQVSLPTTRYGTSVARANFYSEALVRLQSVPGIIDAAAVTQLPLSENNWAMEIALDGPEIVGTPLSADAAAITPHYFKVMGIPLLQGREFTDEDGSNQDHPSLIVSDSFARFYWPNQNPVGKRFRPGKTNPFGTVVGVVGDVRSKMQEEVRPAFYFPHRYIGMPAMVLVVRTSAPSSEFTQTVRSQIQAIDPQLPIYNTRTMKDVISKVNAQPRFETGLLGLFSLVALFLAAVGIYGLMAYMVLQRRHDIGVMIALGAHASNIRNMILKQGMQPVLIGVALGILGCFAIARLMKTLLFGISPTDPFTFIVVAPVLMVVAFAACYLPALRATEIAPSITLKSE